MSATGSGCSSGVYLVVGLLALMIGRGLARSGDAVAALAANAVAVVAAILFVLTLYTADLNVYLTAFLSSIRSPRSRRCSPS